MNAGALNEGSRKGNGSRDEDAPGAAEKTPGPAKKTPKPVKSAGVVPNRASEDDPRAWGDSGSDNDHDAWLREQKPPHWG
ncbi:hypothetical protein [Arthrobacter sp. ISL-5]|uniref:hypothetical protein n=1 Tax=Arthrobacter sp. ISL-5 TaxID=2819111 RepID=UPI001BEBC77C|nr:hypothetical protein [Arthrobacter sp. ISL-5]MBT2555640.1 hypothetical protein [Arthrobacter sp. ISL-5]